MSWNSLNHSLSFRLPVKRKKGRRRKKERRARLVPLTLAPVYDYSLQHFITRTCVTQCINFNARECSHQAIYAVPSKVYATNSSDGDKILIPYETRCTRELHISRRILHFQLENAAR